LQAGVAATWGTSIAVLAAKGGQLRLHAWAQSLGYILVGLIIGLVVRLIVPGRDRIGLFGTLVVAIVGAITGGWAG
jgi:hypothetical protein